MTSSQVALRQRAEYTHKYNIKSGRHGWLRLTPAYSLKVVQEILDQWPGSAGVLDPFSGTATTALCACYGGHEASAVEINPFLVWLGRAKTAQYSPPMLEAARDAVDRILHVVAAKQVDPTPPPALHNIERWWPRRALHFLCILKAALDLMLPDGIPAKTLLLMAFCRSLINLSNAAFDHQSMSFKDGTQTDLFNDAGVDLDYGATFRADANFVIGSAAENPPATCTIVEGDARQIHEIVTGQFDLVITSPPYPNRISYIRELRPYMYWLDYLRSGREAAELDWASIGGTWGAATSRLLQWRRSLAGYYPPYFERILERIADERNPNGGLLSNYVAKYFEDMWTHLQSLRQVLSRKAQVHYIVGNSTFYGVLLPVERLYADMLGELGFSPIETRAVRKRNSKRELVEFDVCATWIG